MTKQLTPSTQVADSLKSKVQISVGSLQITKYEIHGKLSTN